MSKRQLLLLVMLFGMIVATFFLQRIAVAYFTSGAIDRPMTAASVVAVAAFGGGALVVHRLRPHDGS